MTPIELPAWILVNLAVPLLTPVLALFLVRLSKKKAQQYPDIIFEALRYGALYWSVFGMCAAAIYDAWGKGSTETWLGFMAGVSVAWHILLIAVSIVMVLLGVMDAIDESTGANDGKADRGMYTSSIWAAATAAFTYGATHYFFT